MRTGVALVAGAAALTLLPAATAVPAISAKRALVLLGDNRLVAVSVPAGRLRASRRLGPAARRELEPGKWLALSRDRRSVYVLVAGRRDAVVVVDTGTFRVRRRLALASGIRYRGLVLAPAGRWLYAFGNRPRAEGAEDAVVTIVPLGGGPVRTVTVREAAGYDWWTYWGALSADGRRFVLSYHGGCRPRGADWFDVVGAEFSRCPPHPQPNVGCIGEAHGAVEAYRTGFVTARGGSSLAVLDRDGQRLGLVDTGLRKTHLMDFARASDIAYVVGDCIAVEGARAVNLVTGDARAVGPQDACGVRAAAGGRTFVVVSSGSPFQPRVVLVLNRASGRLTGRLTLSENPLDVVLAER